MEVSCKVTYCWVSLNPIRTGGWNPPPPYGFLPFIQKIFLQPIPEISWLFPTFGCGYPFEKKIKIFSFTPSKYRSKNRPWTRGWNTLLISNNRWNYKFFPQIDVYSFVNVYLLLVLFTFYFFLPLYSNVSNIAYFSDLTVDSDWVFV